ncbi:MAG: HDIG domain-containing metalloprotein [Planctomycetota bacterium]
MANGNQKRTRQQRVASVELPPGPWATALHQLQRGAVLLRLGLCVLLAVVLWGLSHGWEPPFEPREGDVPFRDIVARVDFKQPDIEATAEARKKARDLAVAVYDHDAAPISQLRAKLVAEIGELLSEENLEAADPELWARFSLPAAPGTPDPTQEELEEQFARLRKAFESEDAIEGFERGVDASLAPIMQWGILESLPEGANASEVFVRVLDGDDYAAPAKRETSDLLVEGVQATLLRTLNEEMASLEISQRVYAWLAPQLEPTLEQNVEQTRRSQDEAADGVPVQTKTYRHGEDTLAKAGRPLDAQDIELLGLEHTQMLGNQTWAGKVERSLAVFGLYIALYTLCGFYLKARDSEVLSDLGQFCKMLALVLIVVAAALMAYPHAWGAELVPLLIFAMTVTVAYQQEMALLLTAAVVLVAAVALDHNLDHTLVVMAAAAGSILSLRDVRTRSKLFAVGSIAAGVSLFTTVGVGSLSGDPIDLLLERGLRMAGWSFFAGALMTVLLPTVERVFRVQTDLSLIELGDPAHPLLQELIRRAPGTYNHSITVASLAEAAAESIGARGLLVRVGAYFHDIGKMLKPGYFIENQSGDNRHDALVPAMSTLVIIAHVKDGADLGRQHHLPEPIIDFIQQHHGTTLVEYFYRQASEQQSNDPDGGEIDESSFRYPGPKPQSREAGVLMLADAVESASRALKEPTASRIENLVEDISMKRLLDGQFDECGLTLEELHTVGESLVKSLTAVYHGRVKYPGQESA